MNQSKKTLRGYLKIGLLFSFLSVFVLNPAYAPRAVYADASTAVTAATFVVMGVILLSKATVKDSDIASTDKFSESTSPFKNKKTEVETQRELYSALSNAADEYIASEGEVVSPLLAKFVESTTAGLEANDLEVPGDMELVFQIRKSSEAMLQKLAD